VIARSILALACLAAAVSTTPAWAQDPQTGARAKALGGGGTAFEDDPHSIWLNPAGIATQPGGLAISYQTYPFYEPHGTSIDQARAVPSLNDPVFLPSFLGVVVQLGSAELPQALGLCLATPYHLFLPFTGPNPATATPADAVVVDQTFQRLRLSYAIDFRLRAVGEEGFFNHVALGVGADLAIARLEFTNPPDNQKSRVKHDAKLSGGAGLLLGLFDDAESVRATLGVAYQAGANLNYGSNLAVPSGVVPSFDWPEQVQLGLTFHLLEQLPLRICLEAQWTNWRGAAERSQLAGVDGFERSLSLSAGVEYRIALGSTVGFLPRAGLRFYDAPWKHPAHSDLPAWGNQQLFIDTRNGKFTLFSFGFGLSWGYKEGTQDTLDLAGEVGGDSSGFALSYTFQF
jgi:hypothetical protein